MSSYCYYQYCSEGCCNFYGNCPSITGSSLQTQCYYYYYNLWWIYYVIGAGIFLLFVIIGLIACCVRRSRMRQAANQNLVVIQGGTQPSYNYPQSQDVYYQNMDQPQYNNPNQPYQNPNPNPNYQNVGNAAYEMGAVNLNNNQPYFGQPVTIPDQGPGYKVY